MQTRLQIEREQNTSDATLLTYSLAPTTVPTGSVAVLAVGGLNQSGQDVVFNRAAGDNVTITLPDSLCNALGSVGCVSLDPDRWGFNPLSGSPGSFLLRPLLASVTLAPGQGVGVQLTNIAVTGAEGLECQVEVDESIGDDYGSVELPLSVGGPELSISALARPATVTLGKPSTIGFTAIGGSYVTLEPGGQRQDCSGTVYQGTFQVVPAPPKTTYTLTVYDSAGHSAGTTVDVAVGSVAVLSFGPADLYIDFDQQVTLNWTSQYATSATLTPQTTPSVPVNGSRKVMPTALAPDNASEIVFTLTLQGWNGPVQRNLTVRFKPMSVLYFGLPPNTAFPQVQIQNGRGMATQNPPPLPPTPVIWQLNAIGPGGPELRYIGPGPWLETQYFVADNRTVPAGGRVTFSWQTLNATTATLNGQPVPLTLNGTTGTGSTQVTVAQTTTYVLTVADGQGNSQNNQITITAIQ
ncbi:hypothetical protein [Chitinimonas koreensis]|uniref:hypothetical protein n=1 Tax=Chitinimonas koreensis TaxID=356302 RepID=UPI00040D7CFD|nr:hypothetical protein [Chitinimonas koreensis]QNM98722.1 hypothetical protein H9L41_11175 [Chitinimonas koreensis]